MFLKKIDFLEKKIIVAIPLTNGTGKTRVKNRTSFNEYGLPVATKQKKFSQYSYIEWQIGYDIITKDKTKLELTTLKDYKFISANKKEKTLYELSEYIKYFYDWKIISEKKLEDIYCYLENMSESSFLDAHPELSIKRSHPIEKKINDFNFFWTKVEYPLLVYRFDKYEILVEIKITEKQYAIDVQPMLYLCFPIIELNESKEILGRTAKTKETGDFEINENNISIFLELLKIFGTLSSSHNKDIKNIINKILER